MTNIPVPLHIREFIVDTIEQGFGDQYDILSDSAKEEVIDKLCSIVSTLFAGANVNDQFMTNDLRFLQLWILNTVVLISHCKVGRATDLCRLLASDFSFRALDEDWIQHPDG